MQLLSSVQTSLNLYFVYSLFPDQP